MRHFSSYPDVIPEKSLEHEAMDKHTLAELTGLVEQVTAVR